MEDENFIAWIPEYHTVHRRTLDELCGAYQRQRTALMLWLASELLERRNRRLAEPRIIPYILSFCMSVEEARSLWIRILRWHNHLRWTTDFIAWYHPDRVGIVCCGRTVYLHGVEDYSDEEFKSQFPNQTRSKSGTSLRPEVRRREAELVQVIFGER
jgi:hypothetical protein